VCKPNQNHRLNADTQLSCFSREIKRGRKELATAHNENVTLHSTHSARTHPRPMRAGGGGQWGRRVDEIGLRRVSVVRVRERASNPLSLLSLCAPLGTRSYHNRVPDTHLFLPRVLGTSQSNGLLIIDPSTRNSIRRTRLENASCRSSAARPLPTPHFFISTWL
jgi:hypothetical protein